MTKDEIIEMAKKAGIPTGSRFVGGEVVECLTLEVQAFAKLVAEREREECAKECDNSDYLGIAAKHCAEAIRARGGKQ
jgi:hypothetical protein